MMKIGVFGLVLVCFLAVTMAGKPNGQWCLRDSKVKCFKNVNFFAISNRFSKRKKIIKIKRKLNIITDIKFRFSC